METFQVGELGFTLIDNFFNLDVCRYIVRLVENYWISFVGIDYTVDCGTFSNVDFVCFMWQNICGDFLFRRYAITILPDQKSGTLRCL